MTVYLSELGSVLFEDQKIRDTDNKLVGVLLAVNTEV